MRASSAKAFAVADMTLMMTDLLRVRVPDRGEKMLTFRRILFVSTVLFAGVAMADEPAMVLEEVTVVGAVRGSDNVQVANVDMPGDEELKEMPVAYE